MVNRWFDWVLCVIAIAGSGCGVERTATNTGGVANRDTGTCPQGVTVVLSDYVSTNVALSTLDGKTESASLISTASAETAGLAFALSGDVALPSSAPASGRVVLLDRYGTNVISWVDAVSAKVLAQLPVGTGFESNPDDYLEVSDHEAFVTRWGVNATPGREPDDAGSDVLVIDTRAPSIVASVPMPVVDDLPPRPAFLTRLGDDVVVSLERLSADFGTTGDSMLAAVSVKNRQIDWTLTLKGLKECGRATPSPDGKRLAVACSGALSSEGQVDDLSQSAVVLFDATKNPPVEQQRFAAADVAGDGLQSSLAFASEHTVLVKTQTALGSSSNNRLLTLDLDTGKASTLLEARPDEKGGGKGIVYGGVACSPGCSDVCLMADADRSVLQRVAMSGGRFEMREPVVVERETGLPPVGLGLR